jgi:uncharacterized damage-inducible protein DinB
MAEWSAAANFLDFSAGKLSACGEVIEKCVARLSEEQMKRRGGEHENSVINLLLHLEGNVRQWILHGVAGDPDVRQRDEEFTLDPFVSGADALRRLNATLAEARAVVLELPHARLGEVIDPQPTGTWRHATVLEAIYKVVTHLDHHAGQIVLLTKQLAGTDLDLSMPRKR